MKIDTQHQIFVHCDFIPANSDAFEPHIKKHCLFNSIDIIWIQDLKKNYPKFVKLCFKKTHIKHISIFFFFFLLCHTIVHENFNQFDLLFEIH